MLEKEVPKISRCRAVLSQVLACSALDVLLIDLGMSVSFATTVLPVLLNAKEGLSINQHQASWFGSVVFLCQPLGSIFSGPMLDYVGRRKALFLVNIPHVLAWILMHYSWNIPSLIMANALLGFGTGIMEAPSVTYVGEISEPSIRGILTTLTCTFTSVGVFTAYLLGSLVPWRQAALVCLAVPITTMVLVLMIPETPIWLLSKGRKDDALKSLCWLRGWTTPEAVAKEFEDLVSYSDISHQCNVCIAKGVTPQPDCKHIQKNFFRRMYFSFRYILLAKETLRPFQLVMVYFAVHISSGLGPIRPNMINVTRAFGMNADAKNIIIIVGILSITMTLVSSSLIKHIGKRMLILTTMLGCSICSLSLAIYAKTQLSSSVFSYNPDTFPVEKSYTPLVLFYLMVSFTTLGIPWVLVSEVFPFKSRGLATGLAAASSYVVFFIATKTNLNVESAFHLSGAYGLYSTIGFLGTIYLYFYLPETENRTLVEIEGFYSGEKKIFADDPVINCFRCKKKKVVETDGLMSVNS